MKLITKRQGTALFVSLMLHMSLMASVSLQLKGCGGGGNGANAAAGEEDGTDQNDPEHPELTNITVIDNPPPMPTPEEEPLPKLDEEFLGLLKNRPPEPIVDEKCLYSFNGIGVEYANVGKLLVGKVYPGYPAERAGIRPGDMIQTVTGEDIIGAEGTKFQLRVTRDGNSWVMELTREKICFKRNQ